LSANVFEQLLYAEVTSSWNELFAASVISAVIPLLILLPLQRYIQGVAGSAVKG
jgi:ABC-type glycerol-3-phosphate transport system permease component